MKRKEVLGHNDGGGAARAANTTFIRRREEKFAVEVASAVFLREEIARHLPTFEFCPGFPQTYITTVYYDTRDRSFYRQAERSYDNNVKIRVKEYSYRNSGGFLSPPNCYVELKQREKGTVLKRRVPLPKEDLSRLLSGEDVWGSVLKLNCETNLAALEAAYKELRRYIARYEVFVTSIISYRRLVYQKAEDELRITFDDAIAVYDVDPGIHESVMALNPENLGQPTRRYEKVILEIKCPSCQYPDWLQNALRHHVAKRLSKFTTSVRYLMDRESCGDRHVEPNGHPDEQPDEPARRTGRRAASGASDDKDDTSVVTNPIES